jgi:hypothetical protein
MRYNLESTLPINAFSPRGGRSPFAHGMTLEGGGGGGGILAPVTNAVSGVVKGVTDVVKGVVQPVYNATLKQIPGVDNALVNLDKSVGKAIPGGWGTVASVAASFIPGGQLATMSSGLLTPTRLAVGLGALSGSGVMRGKHEFNLQGAIMGGAMAYGASQLGEAFQQAGRGAAQSVEEAAKEGLTSAVSKTPIPGPEMIDVNAGLAGTSPPAAMPPAQSYFNAAQSNIDPSLLEGMSANQVAQSATQTPFQAAQSNIDPSLLEGMSANQVANANVLNPPTPTGLDALAQAGKGTMSNMADAGAGVKNLLGFGADGSAAAARAAFTGASSPITQGGVLAGIMGYSGMAALEEQQKYLDQQLATGNIAQSQYDAEKAKIEEQRAFAQKTVEENPLHASTDPSTVSNDPSLYGKASAPIYASRSTGDTLYDKNPLGGTELLYAMGGEINPPDDQTGIASGTPLRNFEQGGIYGLAAGGMPPRFLSGGGDGMSDSIKASINGNQEARLADGEFVIPADVVSHLGNGSSKAGAKQLYSMMDKVRTARTGRKSQGKQINPRKYLTA